MSLKMRRRVSAASYKGRKACSMGTVGCLSFFPSKNLGGIGDGGMIVTNDEELADKIAMLRDHGMRPKYYYKYIGGNFRLDTLQAAALLVKLQHLDAWSEKRRRNAALYNELLSDCAEVATPVIRPYNTSVFNQYVIRVQTGPRWTHAVSAGQRHRHGYLLPPEPP